MVDIDNVLENSRGRIAYTSVQITQSWLFKATVSNIDIKFKFLIHLVNWNIMKKIILLLHWYFLVKLMYTQYWKFEKMVKS